MSAIGYSMTRYYRAFVAPELEIMSHSWSVLAAISSASLLSFLGTGNQNLFLLALGMQTLEILTEWGSKARRHDKTFDPKKNFVGKLMVLSLVALALMLDQVFIQLSNEQVADHFEQWRWVTKSTLIWIIIGEAVCVLRHIEDSEGKGVIPPAVRWVLRQIRIMDEKRWPGGDGNPPRRWYDDLDDDDIAIILKRMDEKRKAGDEVEATAEARDPRRMIRDRPKADG